MTKRFFSPVFLIDEVEQGLPESFVIEINDTLAARIRELTEVAKAVGAATISVFSDEGVWSALELDNCLEQETAGEGEERAKAMAEAAVIVDERQLHVTPSAFYFSAEYSSMGGEVGLRSTSIPVSQLI